MKKIICLICTICILIGSVPVYAADDVSSANILTSDVIVLSLDRNGNYVASDATANSINSSSQQIIARATDEEGLYHISGNHYATATGTGAYQLSDRYELNPSSSNANNSFFESHSIPQETRTNIAKTINEQKALGNDDLRVTILVPAQSANNGSELCSVSPNGKTTTTESGIYYYENVKHKDYSVKYWNCSTPMDDNITQVRGQKAKNVASQLFNIFAKGLSTAGFKKIALFNDSISALEAYQEAFAPVSRGSQDDEIRVKIIYDKIEKTTYWGLGSGSNIDWTPGLVTYKVWLNKDNTYQYYSAVGDGYLHCESINKVFYSDNYNNPAKEIFDAGYPCPNYDFHVELKICGRRYFL